MSSLPSYNFISRKQTKLFSSTLQEEKEKKISWNGFHITTQFSIANSHIHQEVSHTTTYLENSSSFVSNFASKTILDNEIKGIPLKGFPPTTSNHILFYFLAFI
jgi:hypothetical protein